MSAMRATYGAHPAPDKPRAGTSPRKSILASTTARIAVRHLWADLELRSQRVSAAADGVPAELLKALQFKGATGAQRALERILARMPEKPFAVEGRAATWRVFTPLEHSIQVELLGCGLRGTARFQRFPFALSYSRHSLMRLIDRTGGANLIEEMIIAHNSLLHLSPIEGEQIYNLPSVVLPTSLGAFLATPRSRDHPDFPGIECQTWILRDQLDARQGGELAAWDILVSLEPPAIVKKRG